MTATTKLLDAFKKAKNITTDMAAADALGASRQMISNWRNSGKNAHAEAIEKMALAIGDLPGPWLALIQAEKETNSKNPHDKQVWLRLAKTFGVTLTLALIINLPAHVAHATAATAASVATQTRHLHQLRHD